MDLPERGNNGLRDRSAVHDDATSEADRPRLLVRDPILAARRDPRGGPDTEVAEHPPALDPPLLTVEVAELRATEELDAIPGDILELNPVTARVPRPGQDVMEVPLPTERPDAPIEEGTIWDGRYRIERSLGEGGMGNVLLASDLADDERPVALKVLHPSFREVATPYFMREYSIQRTLRHPSIARALDLGFDLQSGEEVPYFAMPFVPGMPLTSVIDSRPPLEKVWRWVTDILEALDAIHRAGILHRDIKPGNILVDPIAEDGPAARIIDFGIAVSLSAEPEEFFIGTPEFTAPERIECRKPFSPTSDLYAVGLILHELLEAEPPWPGLDPDTLLQQRRESPPRPITRDVSPGVGQLVRELLDPDPTRRPPSAAIVIERLRAVTGLGAHALGSPTPIETPDAFAMRVSAMQIASASYRRALETEAEVLVIHVPVGHDGSELLDELGDRRALDGYRVVRLKLEGKAERPLGELQGALDVFRRLRERSDEKGRELANLRGMAGAAVLLTRLHRKTVLVVDGLEQADEATLMVLSQAFLGAQNRELQVVATVATTATPKAPGAFEEFLAQEFVTQVTLEPLTLPETANLVERALGPGLLDPQVIETLHESALGRPTEVQRLLIEAFRRGILMRRPEGYLWLPEEDERPVDPEASGLLVVDVERDLADRLSLLQTPIPEAVAERFIGDAVGFRRLIGTEVLLRTAAGEVVAAQRDACAWRYSAMEPRRRSELHRELASVIAQVGGVSLAGLVAEQLAQTWRPAAATPWLVIAAQQARTQGEGKRAQSLLQRATELLAHDDGHDEVHGEWRLMVLSARLEVAQASAEVGLVQGAAAELLDAAVECAHLPSIERALAAELDLAEESWDLEGLHSGVERLLLFQQSCGGPAIEALRAWQRAFEAAVEGDPPAVFRWVSVGLRGLDMGSRLSRWLRKKLVVLQANVAVHSGFRQVAGKALEALERLLYREQSETSHRMPMQFEVDAPPSSLAAVALSPVHPSTEAIEARLVALQAAWAKLNHEPGHAKACLEAYELRPGARPRAVIAIELAQLDVETNQLEDAQRWAREAMERANRERCPQVAALAEGVMAEVAARRGDLELALTLLEPLARSTPGGLPQVALELKQRWVSARLALLSRQANAEGRDLFEDADALARFAARVNDVGATARAVFLLVQIALRTRRPIEALANADWLDQLASTEPIGAPPRHAIEWLVASVHYQLKWFKSANAMSRRAMETLRIRTQETPANEREAWLASDRSFIGYFR